jgi:hypothetical protein
MLLYQLYELQEIFGYQHWCFIASSLRRNPFIRIAQIELRKELT